MQKLLITGGTGFLGRALAKKMKTKYSVFIAGRNNTQNLWAQRDTGCPFLPLDVTNMNSIKDVFIEVKPDIVIHAAATKFVDFSEKFPNEAIDINVVGSQNVARICMEDDIDTLIGISTDKAAPPLHNIYSLTKSLMERLYCSLNSKSNTKMACVRFGNIAWSSGSVFPIWEKMHKEDGVIQSTGPHMSRYFFTIDEAVELVESCLSNINFLAGSVVTRDMKAVTIRDLLDVWTKHFGGKWVQMDERPGDSLGEHLVGDIELPYTSPIQLNGKKHFKITFNQKSSNSPLNSLNTDTAERMNEHEILNLIKANPSP
jgi:UDP-glucose 4-epimerase